MTGAVAVEDAMARTATIFEYTKYQLHLHLVSYLNSIHFVHLYI